MDNIAFNKDNDEPPEDGGSLIHPSALEGDLLCKQNTKEEDWNNWQWQFKNRINNLNALSKILNLDLSSKKKYAELLKLYPFAITPYYFSLIDQSDSNDPIALQCLPNLKEIFYKVVGNKDPLHEEKDTKVLGLVHRYPDRVLAVVTNSCAMYCRHCTRKRIWKKRESAKTKKELNDMVQYVKKTPQIREVIISGGDPLTINLELLDNFLGQLRMIPHVEILRIGTRMPVVLPMRITEELVSMLKSHRPLWINTQFNHPREITAESHEACEKLLQAGIPVSNQTVLLKGINDNVQIMKELCHSLQRIMVRPYYLFHCDPVDGVEHFRTNVWKGTEIIENMRGHTGGLCVPTYVVDAPGGGGKIPLQSNYLLSMNENEILLRTFEMESIRYFNPQGSTSECIEKNNHN